MGLECKEGYECFCRPCIKAYEVDVYQHNEGSNETDVRGCSKMSLCGSTEQTKPLTFHVFDNKQRVGANVEALMHMGQSSTLLDVREIEPFLYEFHWTETKEVGVAVLEVSFDGEQIPQSPIRAQVIERRCEVDYPGSGRVADQVGTCVCGGDTVDIGGKCVESSIFAIVGSVGGLVIVGIGVFLFMRYKNHKADEMWQVDVDELHFDDPVEIIGQGSFGQVLLAEFRGTKVSQE